MTTSTSNGPTSNNLTAGDWTLDPKASSIGFRAKLFLGLTASGRFERIESTVKVGASAADSSVSVTVWTDTINTGKAMRDKHLREESLLACERCPTLTFTSTEVRENGTGLTLSGVLTARDISTSITFNAVRVSEAGPPRYQAEVPVSPKDHGITRRGVSKPLLATLDVVLVPAQA